jgi:hypothetical protein
MPLRVDQMFAFLAKDITGDEGVIAWPAPDGGIMPLLGADMNRIESVRKLAQQIADARGVDVTLAVFSVREDRETLKPKHYKPKG